MLNKTRYLNHIEKLLTQFEGEEKAGIFFKLERDKDPLEILGVLDFLKFKIKKWGNDNIFSYLGTLFNKNTVLIVGATNIGEANIIIKYMYLTQIIKKKEEFDRLIEQFENIDSLEPFLDTEISKNMKKGFPGNPKLEEQLRNHLKKLMDS
ncbi:MAG: hypothetical protein ACW986_02655 [Promethearchaeota archaeon]